MRKFFLLFLLFLPAVFAANLQDAQDAYFNASLDIQHMKLLKLPTASLEDTLDEMGAALNGTDINELINKAYILNQSGEADKIALAQELYAMVNTTLQTGVNPGVNYSFVVEKALWIHEMKGRAFAASELILEAGKSIRSVNESLNLSAVHATMLQASRAFAAERYDEIPALVRQAQDQLEQAQVEAARQRAFFKLGRRNIINYVQDHWFGLLITLIVVGALGTWAFLEVRLYNAIHRIKKLRAELHANESSQRDAQEEYFTGKTGSGTYNSRMDLFRRKHRELVTEIQVAEKLLHSYRKTSLILRLRQQ